MASNLIWQELLVILLHKYKLIIRTMFVRLSLLSVRMRQCLYKHVNICMSESIVCMNTVMSV